MHYVEYIYLLSTAMICIFMALERSILPPYTQLQLGIAAGACLLMYGYRRKQRLKREKTIAEEMEKLYEEEETY